MQADVPRRPDKAHDRHRVTTVLDDVLQRLLRDAEQAERRLRRYPAADPSLSELDPDVALARHVAAEAFDGGRETEEVQLWRVEVMRQAVDVARDVGRALEELRHRRRDLCWRQRCPHAQTLDIDAQERKLLAQVVVKIAREAVALRLLRGNQPAGEVLGIRATRTERRLGRAECMLGPPSSRPLDEQRRDERRSARRTLRRQ